MDQILKLYDFVEMAERNRKYPVNTAQGRRAALKLFDTVLHQDERQDLELIEERMNEIFLSLITKHKGSFSIQSLNTYKGRFLKVIQDFKRYGAKPETMVRWEAKARPYVQKIKDDSKDASFHNVSFPVHKGVHKFDIALENGEACHIEAPANINSKDIARIKNILDGLSK